MQSSETLRPRSLWSRILPYLIGVSVPLAVGGLATLLSGGGKDFYETVALPSFAPPAPLFPIVWTVLYLLMGFSATRVLLRRERDPSSAQMGLIYAALSLYANFIYTIIFFRFRLFLVSFLLLLVLLTLIILTIVKYRHVSRAAARAQIPYAVWTTLATALTLAIYHLNR